MLLCKRYVKMIHIKCEMFIFICADSVWVHRQSPDSLMTSCPHISSLTAPLFWRQKHRVEEEEEGGGTRDMLNHSTTLRMHWRAACKICSTAEQQRNWFLGSNYNSERVEELHFCTCLENRKVVFVCVYPWCVQVVVWTPQLCYRQPPQREKNADYRIKTKVEKLLELGIESHSLLTAPHKYLQHQLHPRTSMCKHTQSNVKSSDRHLQWYVGTFF